MTELRISALQIKQGPTRAIYSFGIDGKQFEPKNKPYLANLNTAEEWRLVNA